MSTLTAEAIAPRRCGRSGDILGGWRNGVSFRDSDGPQGQWCLPGDAS
jgi:hypothetical protein